MPLMHTTDLYRFREILRTSTLSPKPCSVFDGDSLLYLFYGRPAYRPNMRTESSSILAYRPVCLILEHDVASSPKRVFPFDSGAYTIGLYNQHVHDEMDISSFEMKPVPESARKVVRSFFGNNKNYYLGIPNSNLSMPNFAFEANAYYNLISEKGKTPYDDRRASIEIQIKEEIHLSRSNIMAVCMPTSFCDEHEVLNMVTNVWKADILPYPSYHASPSEDVRSIFDAVIRYLEEFRYV